MAVTLHLLVSLACAGALAPTDPKAEFERAWTQVQKHADAGRWKEAKSLLSNTLDAHATEPYVRAHLEEIRKTLTDCSFELAVPNRGVKGVFHGEVASYEPKRGDIELRWQVPKQADDAPPAKFPGDDFEKTEVGMLLRAPFDGPCTFEIAGKALGQGIPFLIGCHEGPRHYEAKFDAGSLSALYRVLGEERRCLSSTSDIFNVGRPYELKLTVRETQVEASFNGKRLVGGEKPKTEWGRVGYRDVLKPQKITAKGKVRVAWVNEQIGAFRSKERAEFEKTYDVKAELPEPLR